ncbi:MAG: molybdenum cofactor guanylyltransferase [Planctomycetota bacterium]
MTVGALVLAGGFGRRMGQPKATVDLEGRTLLGRSIDCVSGLAREVVVCARDSAQELPPLRDQRVVFDRSPGGGPLQAIATGLSALATVDRAIVLACDVPFVTTAALEALLDRLDSQSDGVVPKFDGRAQPLCAVYRTSLLEPLEALLEAGEQRAMSLTEFDKVLVLSEAESAAIDPSGSAAFDIDTPEQLEAARRRLRGG